jgi:hypothetical protein
LHLAARAPYSAISSQNCIGFKSSVRSYFFAELHLAAKAPYADISSQNCTGCKSSVRSYFFAELYYCKSSVRNYFFAELHLAARTSHAKRKYSYHIGRKRRSPNQNLWYLNVAVVKPTTAQVLKPPL